MDSFHKAFDVIGTMSGRTSGMACYFCKDRIQSDWKHCTGCGYPLKLSTECLSVRAPESLIKFAKQWHSGKLTALFKVQEDGRILHRNLLLLVQELKDILNDSRAVARGPSTREEIEDHLHALEYLHGQQ